MEKREKIGTTGKRMKNKKNGEQQTNIEHIIEHQENLEKSKR